MPGPMGAAGAAGAEGGAGAMAPDHMPAVAMPKNVTMPPTPSTITSANTPSMSQKSRGLKGFRCSMFDFRLNQHDILCCSTKIYSFSIGCRASIVYKLIAHAVDRQHVLRLAGVGLDLAAQVLDMGV